MKKRTSWCLALVAVLLSGVVFCLSFQACNLDECNTFDPEFCEDNKSYYCEEGEDTLFGKNSNRIVIDMDCGYYGAQCVLEDSSARCIYPDTTCPLDAESVCAGDYIGKCYGGEHPMAVWGGDCVNWGKFCKEKEPVSEAICSYLDESCDEENDKKHCYEERMNVILFCDGNVWDAGYCDGRKCCEKPDGGVICVPTGSTQYYCVNE